MSQIYVMAVVGTLLIAQVLGQGCDCSDSPPPAADGKEKFSCAQQKDFGKCDEGFMLGFCECTCDRCCLAPCNNLPPDSSFTCKQQKEFGKCNEQFMQGFCECECDRCTSGTTTVAQQAVGPIQESIDEGTTTVAQQTAGSIQESSDEGKECEDNLPFNAPFNCSSYAELGLCSNITEGFCQQSCNQCPVTCEDVLHPGYENCSVVVQQNLCQSSTIRGVYCAKSCGHCEESCDDPEALHCDVQGLLAFKKSLKSGREYLESWQGDNPCVNWTFVECFQNRVQFIEVINDDLDSTMQASLVPEISKLRYLSFLQLSDVQLNGELPEEYSVLDQLRALFIVSENVSNINGTLPVQYSQWKNIQFFTIQSSQITGSIPTEYSLWTSLFTFNIGGNQITGSLPPNFSKWEIITTFFAVQNKITGTLPKEYSQWQLLGNFEIFSNRLTGSLPREYSTLSGITYFGAQDNILSNTLPLEYSTWIYCQNFLFQINIFTGSLPIQYSTMNNMTQFQLYDNKLKLKELPKEYSTMVLLEIFTLWGNDIVNSTIPKEWSKIQEQNASIIV